MNKDQAAELDEHLRHGLIAMVEEWNEEHPVGTEIIAINIDGSRTTAKIIEPGEILGSDMAYVRLEGIGVQSLSLVTDTDPADSAHKIIVKRRIF